MRDVWSGLPARLADWDGHIRRRWPQLWHLQTMPVVLYALLGSLVATIVVWLTSVTPKVIPRIDTGFIAAMLVCAVAACAWLARITRSMRWPQLAQPAATPSFALAALHGWLLFLPAFVYGDALGLRIERTIPVAEARLKGQLLRHYILLSDFLNNLSLLRLGPGAGGNQGAAVPEMGEHPSENEAARARQGPAGLIRHESSGITVFSFDHNIYESTRRVDSIHIPFNKDTVLLVWRNLDQLDAALQRIDVCYSASNVALLLRRLTSLHDAMPWTKEAVEGAKQALGPNLLADLHDREFFLLLKEWIERTPSFKIEGRPRPRGLFGTVLQPTELMTTETFSDTGNCSPATYGIAHPVHETRVFVLQFSEQYESMKKRMKESDAFGKIIRHIVRTHCCENKVATFGSNQRLLRAGPIEKPKDREVENLDLSGIALRLKHDRGLFDMAIRALDNAEQVSGSLLDPSVITHINAMRELSIPTFGNRLLHYLALVAIITILILQHAWRAVGWPVFVRACWAAAAVLAVLLWLGADTALQHQATVAIMTLAAAAAALAIVLLQPAISPTVRIAVVTCGCLLPMPVVIGWMYLYGTCTLGELNRCGAKGDYPDYRMWVTVAALTLLVMLAEAYFAVLKRIVVKPM